MPTLARCPLQSATRFALPFSQSLSGPPGSHGRCCPLVAKVSDFGLAFKMEGEETHVSGMYQG